MLEQNSAIQCFDLYIGSIWVSIIDEPTGNTLLLVFFLTSTFQFISPRFPNTWAEQASQSNK